LQRKEREVRDRERQRERQREREMRERERETGRQRDKSVSFFFRLTKLRRRQRPPDFSSNEPASGNSGPNRSISAPPVRPPHLIFAAVQEETSTQGGPEPQFWGLTLPSRIESLFPETDLPELLEEEVSGLREFSELKT
jgi:hypothetical protein